MKENNKWEYAENANMPNKEENSTTDFSVENWFVGTQKEENESPIKNESSVEMPSTKPNKKNTKVLKIALILNIVISIISSVYLVIWWEFLGTIAGIISALAALLTLVLQKSQKANVEEVSLLIFVIVAILNSIAMVFC